MKTGRIHWLFLLIWVIPGLYPVAGQAPKAVSISLPEVRFTSTDLIVSGQKDRQLLSRITELINATTKDSEITISIFKLDADVKYLDEDINLHTKYFIIESTQNNKKSGVVWTGSANLTERSLRLNFEVVLEVRDQKIYDYYLHNFNQINLLD